MNKQCTGCVVSAGTHKPAEALHQIEDSSDGWIQDGPLLYRLTEGKKPKNRDEINVTMADGSRTEEARTRRAGQLMDAIRAAAPQECSRSHPHEEMTPMCELRTEIARLTNALARAEAAQQARIAELEKDAARLLHATKDYDGFVHVDRDKYSFLLKCMEEAGRSEPTYEDELNGVRRLIDAAIAAEAKQGGK